MIDINKSIVIIVAFTSSFIVNIDISAVEFMLPRIAVSMNATIHQAGYLITGYLLGLTCFAVPAGYISDLYSRKKMYIIGLAGFGVSSFFLSLSTDITLAITWRVLQGVSSGLITSVGFAYIVESFEETRRGKAFTYIAASISLGYLAGPSLGGWFIGISGWYLIFAINIPLMAALIILAIKYLPEIPPQIVTNQVSLRSLDYMGFVFFVVGIGVIFAAVDQYTNLTLNGVIILSILFVGSLYGIYLSNQKNNYPMIDIYLFFQNSNYLFGCFIVFFSFISAYIIAFIMPFYVLNVPTLLSITELGYLLTFFPLGFVIGSILGGMGMNKFGPVRTLVFVNIFIPITVLGLLFLDKDSGVWTIGFAGFFVGLGRGFFIAPFNTLISQSVPTYRIAAAGGLISVIRNLGMIVGTTLAPAIITSRLLPNLTSETTSAVNLAGDIAVFYLLVSLSALSALIALAFTIILSISNGSSKSYNIHS